MSEDVNLKEFHDVLLSLMIEFDRICMKNEIKYTISYGTMLGAVRHQGFIPWDDDVDIMMLRDDFDKFNRVCNNDLNADFYLQNSHTDDKYPYNIARLRKNNTAMIYSHWKDSGIHQGIYIDICPLDNLCDGKVSVIIQKLGIVFFTPLRIAKNKEIFEKGGENFSKWLKKVLFIVSHLFSRKMIKRIEYCFMTAANHKDTSKIGVICEGGVLLHTPKDMIPFDRHYMDEFETVNFENHDFMISSAKLKMLEHWYGDYMKLPPIEERKMFHQPLLFSTIMSFEKFLNFEDKNEEVIK